MLKSRIKESDEVDLTPMIDVVFQLIIFFMVVMAIAAVYGVAIKFPPPGSSQSNQNKKKEKNIIVYIQSDHLEKGHQLVRDGILKINGEEIPLTQTLPEERYNIIKTQNKDVWAKEREEAYDFLKWKMKELLDKGYKDDVLIVQGDMKTYHGKIMRVIDKAKDLKVNGFSLVPPTK
ncbi:MAG: hypothetical protein GF401_04220 [Chitinivibrionales bacterium]|nr:hypothetical protein [Chitinivibrionales bacterium]